MRKQIIPALFASAILAMVAIVGIATVKPDHDDGEDVDALVDDSIAQMHSWRARCPTMDGGVDADLLVNVDGGATYSVTDYTVTSTSSTCVRVGGDSFVDQNHGVPVGAGSTCAAGQILPMHARVGRCQSTGAEVIVNVTGGKP